MRGSTFISNNVLIIKSKIAKYIVIEQRIRHVYYIKSNGESWCGSRLQINTVQKQKVIML